jgi:hypothetical protein
MKWRDDSQHRKAKNNQKWLELFVCKCRSHLSFMICIAADIFTRELVELVGFCFCFVVLLVVVERENLREILLQLAPPNTIYFCPIKPHLAGPLPAIKETK